MTSFTLITSVFVVSCLGVAFLCHRAAKGIQRSLRPNLVAFDHFRQLAIGHLWMAAVGFVVIVEPKAWHDPETDISIAGLIIWFGWIIGTYVFMRAQQLAREGKHPLQKL